MDSSYCCLQMTNIEVFDRLYHTQGVLEVEHFAFGRNILQISDLTEGYVYFKNNEIVGYVLYQRYDEDHTIWVDSVAVLQLHQGQGIASRLLEELIHNNPSTPIELVTWAADPRLVDFYAAHGFQDTGRLSYYGRPVLRRN